MDDAPMELQQLVQHSVLLILEDYGASRVLDCQVAQSGQKDSQDVDGIRGIRLALDSRFLRDPASFMRIETLIGHLEDKRQQLVDLRSQGRSLLGQPSRQDSDGSVNEPFLLSCRFIFVGGDFQQQVYDGGERPLQTGVQRLFFLLVQIQLIRRNVIDRQFQNDVARCDQISLGVRRLETFPVQLHSHFDRRQLYQQQEKLFGFLLVGHGPLHSQRLQNAGRQDQGRVALLGSYFALEDVGQALVKTHRPRLLVGTRDDLLRTIEDQRVQDLAQLELPLVVVGLEIDRDLVEKSVEGLGVVLVPTVRAQSVDQDGQDVESLVRLEAPLRVNLAQLGYAPGINQRLLSGGEARDPFETIVRFAHRHEVFVIGFLDDVQENRHVGDHLRVAGEFLFVAENREDRQSHRLVNGRRTIDGHVIGEQESFDVVETYRLEDGLLGDGIAVFSFKNKNVCLMSERM